MPRFTKTQLFEIAKAKFETLMTEGTTRKNDKLRTMFPYLKNARDPDIAEAIRMAFVDDKLYEFRKVEDAAAFLNAATDPILESRLKSTFGLRQAVVVKWPPEGVAIPSDADQADDLMTEALGAAMAKVLAGSSEHGSRIGIGGGRCCYRASLVFRSRFADQTAEDVRIYALAGNFNVRSQAAREKNVGVDASLNAYRLTNAWLDISCHLEPLLAPALIADEGKLATYKADTWLGRASANKPEIGIVGVGGLLNTKGEHSSYGRGLTDIAAVSGDASLIANLDLIMRLSIESLARTPPGQAPYQMIGDCANRLCVVAAPPNYRVEPAKLAEARKAVAAINKHLLAVSETDLLAMGLNVVGGGRSKSLMLHSLLREPGLTLGRPQSSAKPVRVVCTDSECARLLLELETQARANALPGIAPAKKNGGRPLATSRARAGRRSPDDE